MKNLYERLKPEYKYKLELEALEYPTVMDSLVRQLRENVFISDLRFEAVDYLKRYCDVDLNYFYSAFETD